MVSCGYLSGILHRVLERLLVDDVQVHVEAALVEIHVEGLDGARRSSSLVGQVRLLRRDRDGVADAVLRILVGQLRDRQAGREPAMAVAAVHRVGARARTARPCGGRPACCRSPCRRPRCEVIVSTRLRVHRVAIGRVLAELLHEARDEVGRDAGRPGRRCCRTAGSSPSIR